MIAISHLSIVNFRSIPKLTLPLARITPIIGVNNSGKSNILAALKWSIEGAAMPPEEHNDPEKDCTVEILIQGVSEDALDLLHPLHKDKLIDFVNHGQLQLRRISQGKKGRTGKKKDDLSVELWHPSDKEWKRNPAGIDNAIRAVFPEIIHIEAMVNAADDVSKAKAGSAIGRLLGIITESIFETHETEIKNALSVISDILATDGASRSKEFDPIDGSLTRIMQELLPGIRLNIEIPAPKFDDLSKQGYVTFTEVDSSRRGSISQLGHGAQRCTQMALLRYIAEHSQSDSASSSAVKVLLIDEPELYLHPSAIEIVASALERLSNNRFQVVFSTHSPLLVSASNIADTCLVKRSPSGVTQRRGNASVAKVIRDKNMASAEDVVFELSHRSEVLFFDTAIICEGKSDEILLPAAYKAYFGNRMNHDRIALLRLNGSGLVSKCRTVLEALDMKVLVIVDLDFVFTKASEILDSTGNPIIDTKSGPICDAKNWFAQQASADSGFSIDNDSLPKKGSTYTAEEFYHAFAADATNAAVLASLKKTLAQHRIFFWEPGSIEHAFEMDSKGSDKARAIAGHIEKSNTLPSAVIKLMADLKDAIQSNPPAPQ